MSGQLVPPKPNDEPAEKLLERIRSKGNPMPQDELGISVLKSACGSEAKDLAVDLAEVGLDSILDEGVLKDAPMLGAVVKTCAISKTIRDRLFVRKVWDFLRACPRFNDLEKLAFVREHLDAPEKARRLGDAIVLILDKMDDLDKPQMLAKVFAALVRGKIGLDHFRRLASAIDIGFSEDLKEFIEKPTTNPEETKTLFRNLVRTGLVDITGPKLKAEPGLRPIYFEVSELGNVFRQCMAET
jgi:hypothetical protein